MGSSIGRIVLLRRQVQMLLLLLLRLEARANHALLHRLHRGDRGDRQSARLHAAGRQRV